jgi:hypothetical protein
MTPTAEIREALRTALKECGVSVSFGVRSSTIFVIVETAEAGRVVQSKLPGMTFQGFPVRLVISGPFLRRPFGSLFDPVTRHTSEHA